MQTITFILNGHEFNIPSSRKLLNKIPENKEAIYTKLFNEHKYYVNSKVRDETFQSFLDNWQNDTDPQIDSDNITEYYQLVQELGVFSDYLSQPQYEPLLFVNLLKTDSGIQYDRSDIERTISLHLDDYLNEQESDLSNIRLTSLFNIFAHPERKLSDQDKAYKFIVRISETIDTNFYALLETLDVNEFQNDENKLDSFESKSRHFGFSPKNTDQYILSDLRSTKKKERRN